MGGFGFMQGGGAVGLRGCQQPLREIPEEERKISEEEENEESERDHRKELRLASDEEGEAAGRSQRVGDQPSIREQQRDQNE
jgi:hypothetical protein